MPGNGFAFPVRVGCEVDVFGFFGSGNNRIDMFAVAADELVFHRKAVVGIDRAAFGDEVADVSVGREDFKIAAQIFFRVLALDGDSTIKRFFAICRSLDGGFDAGVSDGIGRAGAV